MKNQERIAKLKLDMLKSAHQQGKGVYDRIELALEDFDFLLREAEKANNFINVLNEEKYSNAHDLVSKWSVWHDDKLLVLSVIGRARHLEKEVERLTKKGEQLENLNEELGNKINSFSLCDECSKEVDEKF